MHNIFYALGVTLLLFAIILVTRLLPIFIAKPLAKSEKVMKLGKELPPAIMWILVLETLNFSKANHHLLLIWQVAALLLTVAVQLWQKNLIISIIVGTGFFLVAQHWFM